MGAIIYLHANSKFVFLFWFLELEDFLQFFLFSSSLVFCFLNYRWFFHLIVLFFYLIQFCYFCVSFLVSNFEFSLYSFLVVLVFPFYTFRCYVPIISYIILFVNSYFFIIYFFSSLSLKNMKNIVLFTFFSTLKELCKSRKSRKKLEVNLELVHKLLKIYSNGWVHP